LGIFLILCAGVFICGWTYKVIAETIISSTIEAPPLQDPAVIQNPADQTTVTTQPISVSGTCPLSSYVKLFVNSSFGGVAWCHSGVFALSASLREGSNQLTAQDYNETDLAGPASPGITVIYQPDDEDSQTQGSGTTSGSSTEPGQIENMANTTQLPLLLSSDFHFQTFTAQKSFTWTGNLTGGTPPYNMTINWGDGSTSHMYFPTDPPFTLNHVYAHPGYYPVVLTSVDAHNQTQVMQLAALITDSRGQASFLQGSNGTPSSASINRNTSSSWSTNKLLLLAWPSYLIIMLMMVSFWLGERKELQQVRISVRR
jgi:hypothetical protein